MTGGSTVRSDGEHPPSPPFFSQVFILKVVKVLCFDTLLQVLILNVLSGGALCIAGVRAVEAGRRYRYCLAILRKREGAGSPKVRSAQIERLRGTGFARRLRRTGWSAKSMSYGSAKRACCQEKYILGELLVRTDWQVVGGARVTEDMYALGAQAYSVSARAAELFSESRPFTLDIN